MVIGVAVVRKERGVSAGLRRGDHTSEYRNICAPAGATSVGGARNPGYSCDGPGTEGAIRAIARARSI